MEADGARENTLVGHGATTGNRRCWNDSRHFAATDNRAAPEACWNRLSPWGSDNKSCNLQLDLLEPAAVDDTSTPFFCWKVDEVDFVAGTMFLFYWNQPLFLLPSSFDFVGTSSEFCFNCLLILLDATQFFATTFY